MSEPEPYQEEDDDEASPRRLGCFSWLILFILVCSLLLPLARPIVRTVLRNTQPTPTPRAPGKFAWHQPSSLY